MGGAFTLSKKCLGKDWIKVILDTILISLDWLKYFSCRLALFPRVGSDHSPISLLVAPIEPRRNPHFRFEKMWTSHLDLLDKVKFWWSLEVEGSAMFRVARKLSNVKRIVKIWNKTNFGNIFHEKNVMSD